MRKRSGLETLRARRIVQADKFAEKAAGSDRFAHWFPMRTSRTTRGGDKYMESYARCDRLYNSPIYYMRRRLNGKEGPMEQGTNVTGKTENLVTEQPLFSLCTA